MNRNFSNTAGVIVTRKGQVGVCAGEGTVAAEAADTVSSGVRVG